MKSCAVMLDVTGAVINTNADSDCIKKVNFSELFFFFTMVSLWLRQLYFKQKTKCNISQLNPCMNRNPCIVLLIRSPDSYTALFISVKLDSGAP